MEVFVFDQKSPPQKKEFNMANLSTHPSLCPPDFKFNTFLFNNLKEEKMPKKESQNNFLAAFSAPQKPNNVIFVEDNDVMTESYLMIAPDGRLFQNGHEEYEYSHPLTEVSIDEALEEINFDQEKFNNRYENYATEEAKYRMEEFFLMNEDDFIF